MTYEELLQETAQKKREAIKELNAAIKNPKLGFLVKHEIEKSPGTIGWTYLAKDFCETFAEHILEFVDQCTEEYEVMELYDLYTAYEDNSDDLYYHLPVEARLFD